MTADEILATVDDASAQIARLSAERQALASVIREAQAILAAYLEPDNLDMGEVIGQLLELLDGPKTRAALGEPDNRIPYHGPDGLP